MSQAGSMAGSLNRQRAFVLALLVFFAAVSVQYSFKAMQSRSAIVRWQHALERLDDGEDIYRNYIHPNSPMMVLILKPFGALPPLAAALAWFYLKVVLTLLAFYWVFRLVETPGLVFPTWAKVLTVLLSLRPIMGDLTHGNVNLLILFLVVAALYAFQRRRELTAGLVLALAIACKVTPLLFVPYLVWKRAWKTLAGCAAGLVLFIGLVPGLFFGFEKNAQLFASWADQMIKPFVLEGKVFYSEHNNQSVPGFLFRMLTHSPSFSVYVGHEYTPTQYHNVAEVSPDVARWLVKGCMGLFALLAMWTCRTPLAPRPNWRLAAEFALVVLGMLLFSERTWKHHCVTLLLPFAVLCYYLAVGRGGPVLRGYVIASLVLAVALMTATSTGLLADHVAKLAQVYGAYVWAYLILSAALMVLLRQPEETCQIATTSARCTGTGWTQC